MDFVDWRRKREEQEREKQQDKDRQPTPRRVPGRISNRVEELIREAQKRGEFDNLEGTGKPLAIDPHREAGDNALAYSILKNSGNVPTEIALSQQIDHQIERARKQLEAIRHTSRQLRQRRVPPFEHEKREYNAEVETAAASYDEALRRINSNILTFNLMVPLAMHRPLLEVEKLVQQFRDDCPLFSL